MDKKHLGRLLLALIAFTLGMALVGALTRS